MTTTPAEPQNNSWMPLGPYGIKLFDYGCISGRVTGIAFGLNPSGGKRIFIATANGGVWYSDNDGHRWAAAMDNFALSPRALNADSLACGAIAVSPSDHKTILVGTGEGDRFISGDQAVAADGLSYEGVGPVRGELNGHQITWHSEQSNLVGHAFYQLAWHPTNDDLVLGATTNGLYKRTKQSNGRYAWNQISSLGNEKVAGVVAAQKGGKTTFYAARWGDGVYKSTNDGDNWTKLPWTATAVDTTKIGRIGLAVRPENPDVVYAIIAQNAQQGNAANTLLGIYRWDDTNKWQDLSLKSSLGTQSPATIVSKTWSDFEKDFSKTLSAFKLPKKASLLEDGWRISDNENKIYYLFTPKDGIVTVETVPYQRRLIPYVFKVTSNVVKSLTDALKQGNKNNVRAEFQKHKFRNKTVQLTKNNAQLTFERYAWVYQGSMSKPDLLVLESGSSLTVQPVYPGLLGALFPQGEYNMPMTVIQGANGADNIIVGGSAGHSNYASLYRCEVTGSGPNMGIVVTYLGPNAHPDVHALVFEPDDYTKPATVNRKKLWVGCDGGIYTGDAMNNPFKNNKPLVPRNVGLATLIMEQMGQHPTQDAILYTGTQDNGGLRYTGDVTWHYKWGGDAGKAVVNWHDPTMFAGEGSGGVTVTDFIIDKYEVVLKYPPLVGVPYNLSNSKQAGRLATGTHKILLNDEEMWQILKGNYKVNNFNWRPIATMDGSGRGARVRALAFANYSTLYAATMDGQIYRLDENKMTNKWDMSTLHSRGGLPTDYRVPVTSFAIDPADSSGNSVYVTFGGLVERGHVWHCVCTYNSHSKKWEPQWESRSLDALVWHTWRNVSSTALKDLQKPALKIPSEVTTVLPKISSHTQLTNSSWLLHTLKLDQLGEDVSYILKQKESTLYLYKLLAHGAYISPNVQLEKWIEDLDSGHLPETPGNLEDPIKTSFGRKIDFDHYRGQAVVTVVPGQEWWIGPTLFIKNEMGAGHGFNIYLVNPGAKSLPNVYHNVIVADPHNKGHLYVGTDIGVWYSADAGTSWRPYADGLPEAPVVDLEIFPPGGPNGQPATGRPAGSSTYPLLRASTYGRGVFERSLKSGFTNKGMHLYLRKNILDRGLYDLPAVNVLKTLEDADGNKVDYQCSPDIKLGVAPSSLQFSNKLSVNGMNFYEFSQYKDATKLAKTDKTAVFLQLQNYGTKWTVPINIYLVVNWNVTKDNLPDFLNDDYYDKIQDSGGYIGGGWEHLGASTLKATDLAVAQPYVPFVVGFDVADKFKTHLTGKHCLLAFVSGPGNTSPRERNIETLCRKHRHVAVKLVTLA